jgi:predicted DNA-binding protein YlxM (UPF0122 family)
MESKVKKEDYTIKEIKEKKEKLEKDVSELIKKFEDEMGLRLENEVHLFRKTNKDKNYEPKVEFQLWLL